MLTDFAVQTENMLELAEDLLAHIVLLEAGIEHLRIYQVSESERDETCPIRLKVGLSEDFLKAHPPASTG